MDASGTAVADQVQEQPQTEVVALKGKKVQKEIDLFADFAHEVENITKPKALALADSLSNNIELNYFKLGGVLVKIQEQGWFDGYESFEAYINERFGFSKSKAFYLIGIYKHLVDKGIPWEKVAHLGWTKLKDLAPVLTLENLDDWIAKAEKLTVFELQAALKAKAPTADQGETTDEVVKKTFKLHADQVETVNSALNKAKAEAHTDFDTVALENICTAYLGGAVATPTLDVASLSTQLQAIGPEIVFNAIEKAFPDLEVIVKQ